MRPFLHLFTLQDQLVSVEQQLVIKTTPTPLSYLLSRDQQDLMASLLNSLLGAGDANVGAGVVRAWNSNLGGSLQLQLLQLLTILPNDKSMVLLGDGDRRRRLEEQEKVFRSK